MKVILSTISCLLRGEFFLRGHENSGGLILARSLFCASIAIFLSVLAEVLLSNQSPSSEAEPVRVSKILIERIPWFGASFALIFNHLNQKFSSQWLYLANLFNSICKANLEMSRGQDATDLLLQWKASFIEDVHNLHLHKKGAFSIASHFMLRDTRIREKIVNSSPKGASIVKDFDADHGSNSFVRDVLSKEREITFKSPDEIRRHIEPLYNHAYRKLANQAERQLIDSACETIRVSLEDFIPRELDASEYTKERLSKEFQHLTTRSGWKCSRDGDHIEISTK